MDLTRRLRYRPQLDHRPAMPSDDHALTGERPIDQLRQPVLGLDDAVRAHGKYSY